MNKHLTFPASDVTTIAAHLAWATLECLTDDVADVQVLAAGDESDVTDLKVKLEGGTLQVEQPTYGLSMKLNTERWMQVVIRIPRTWKGGADCSTIAGPLSVRGMNGTDLTLDTVSGDMRAMNLKGIAVTLRTVTGTVKAGGLDCDKLFTRTVSGNVQVDGSICLNLKLSGVSGTHTLELVRPFEKLDVTTVSGDVKIYAPITTADVVLRAVTGRVKTSGVSITEGGPQVRGTSVSGDLEILCGTNA